MSKGYVIFVVRKSDYNPYFLKFGNGGKCQTIEYKYDPSDATVYPLYEAAEAVANILKDDADYLYVKILDTDGNPAFPCSYDERVNERMSDRTRYINRPASEDEFF